MQIVVEPKQELPFENCTAETTGEAAKRGGGPNHAGYLYPQRGSAIEPRRGNQLCIAFSNVEILMVAKLANVSDTAYGKMIWSLCRIAPQV